jgi:hypothetical protein
MSEREALLWLYLFYVFAGGTHAEITATALQLMAMGRGGS